MGEGHDGPTWRPGGNLGYRINQVARQLTRFFDRRLAGQSVNVAYLPVLGALRGGDQLSQKEFVRIGQIGQPAMAQMLARMVKEGLLIRAADETDGRKALFSLSEQAADRMGDIRAILADGNEQIFSVLSDAEKEAFLKSLEKIEDRLKTLVECEPE